MSTLALAGNARISIVRNVHPEEKTAFLLAKDVAERLGRRGHEATLLTVPQHVPRNDPAISRWYDSNFVLVRGSYVFEFHNTDYRKGLAPPRWNLSDLPDGASFELHYLNLPRFIPYAAADLSRLDLSGMACTLEIPAVWKAKGSRGTTGNEVLVEKSRKAGLTGETVVSKLVAAIEALVADSRRRQLLPEDDQSWADAPAFKLALSA